MHIPDPDTKPPNKRRFCAFDLTATLGGERHNDFSTKQIIVPRANSKLRLFEVFLFNFDERMLIRQSNLIVYYI